MAGNPVVRCYGALLRVGDLPGMWIRFNTAVGGLWGSSQGFSPRAFRAPGPVPSVLQTSSGRPRKQLCSGVYGGVIVKRTTALDPSGFVTRRSQTRSRFGPPDLAVSEVWISLWLTSSTKFTVGAGPEPLSNVTFAPSTKPVPVIVMFSVVPRDIKFGTMPMMLMPSLGAFTVNIVELS